MSNSNYDYNTPVEKTATEIAQFTAALLGEKAGALIIENHEKLDPEAKRAFEENSNDFAIEIMKHIATTDIPVDYASHAITKIITVLEILQKYIQGTIRQNKHEIISRVIGVRDPGSDKYTAEAATVGQLMLKLDEIRTSQGSNMSDYFNTKEDQEREAAEAAAQAETPVEETAPESDLSTDEEPVKDIA